ncbi:hypothetical protein J433_09917 [Corynebacterium glutamicum MT]|uniref:Uncharacterized protein n=1 Tax=Corynebacterium glutamicum TaxID=1718 RepID=A0AB36I607_CORGT|nr:hypothetical protein [Corynebacterium glutamicum]AGN21160.1 hypothetical protein C629_02750 [Corynebacterium glutamicum SCgG2]AGN18137.1 hypothetical protein C624_02750 [Corynebacterium glutamicum SCgG1]EGV41065.1 hypothetical protein CgS9114_05587 [Corynebacterium glutamicum S9114]EOA64129.1 hypothetical protein J433_09917 [Corynebacterium glutamicum MT]EPP41879.1 hypothetical protein A583_02286 [Corynebacterium glutamicum Z188]
MHGAHDQKRGSIRCRAGVDDLDLSFVDLLGVLVQAQRGDRHVLILIGVQIGVPGEGSVDWG